MTDFDAPQSRNEAILQNILGADNELGEPQSRIEALLMQILEQGSGGGGGGDDRFAIINVVRDINNDITDGTASFEEINTAYKAKKYLMLYEEAGGFYSTGTVVCGAMLDGEPTEFVGTIIQSDTESNTMSIREIHWIFDGTITASGYEYTLTPMD